MNTIKLTRGNHPHAIGAFALRSVDLLDQFDAFAEIHKLAPRPLLMIAGSEASTLFFSEEVVKQAGIHAELYIITGASHVDLYDTTHYVDLTVQKLTKFFQENLG